MKRVGGGGPFLAPSRQDAVGSKDGMRDTVPAPLWALQHAAPPGGAAGTACRPKGRARPGGGFPGQARCSPPQHELRAAWGGAPGARSRAGRARRRRRVREAGGRAAGDAAAGGAGRRGGADLPQSSPSRPAAAADPGPGPGPPPWPGPMDRSSLLQLIQEQVREAGPVPPGWGTELPRALPRAARCCLLAPP